MVFWGDASRTNVVLDSIESMKMETIIRSPQKGVIAKLVHKEGVSKFNCNLLASANDFQDICKAGTVLVLFEEVHEAVLLVTPN